MTLANTVWILDDDQSIRWVLEQTLTQAASLHRRLLIANGTSSLTRE